MEIIRVQQERDDSKKDNNVQVHHHQYHGSLNDYSRSLVDGIDDEIGTEEAYRLVEE